MLGCKQCSGTSKTKELLPVLLDFPVLKGLLRYLHPSIIYSASCDQTVQKAYYALWPCHTCIPVNFFSIKRVTFYVYTEPRFLKIYQRLTKIAEVFKRLPKIAQDF